jgi:hypothetical protein
MKSNYLKSMLLAKPRTYSDSLVLNLFGWQLIRIFILWIWRKARIRQIPKKENKQYYKELIEKGAIVIPNFLPDANFRQVKKEFDSLKLHFNHDNSEISLPHVKRMNIFDARVSNNLRNSFIGHPLIESMQRAYTNRPYFLKWNAFLTSISCSNEEAKLPQNGGTNNLHMDVPARTFKAFYYVTAADQNSGVLHYCLGTHRRFSFKALMLQYKLSVRYAWNQYKSDTRGEYKPGDPWVKLTDHEIKKYCLNETPLDVPANSLVIGDVGGYHRRGNFASAGERNTIELNFREVETLRNTIYPLEKFVVKLRARLSK